ncbi:MAG: DUF3137 domain-containing protein [Saprospiraceae bacterium]|nr:DUF3137 domain-containing protein [Saprospiraceae bacterium]
MKNLTDLRQYYNHTIHPELKRMERRRHRLLTTLALSFLGILVTVFFQFYLGILTLTLVLIVPIGLYLTYTFNEWEAFRSTFKPRVVSLLLDFIDNDVTYNVPLKYIENASISPSVFRASRLFNSTAPDFVGEDYIKGEMGELDFEMSELAVKEFSTTRNRLDDVFRGVFLHARFWREVQVEKGEILILPRSQRQHLSKTIKAFTVKGGRQFEYNLSAKFTESFIVYATHNANTRGFLSENMQESILRYRQKEGNEIYLSFIENAIYVAVSQQKDLLEPVLWQSNMSFDLIREFYEDITLLLSIVLDIDANN